MAKKTINDRDIELRKIASKDKFWGLFFKYFDVYMFGFCFVCACITICVVTYITFNSQNTVGANVIRAIVDVASIIFGVIGSCYGIKQKKNLSVAMANGQISQEVV